MPLRIVQNDIVKMEVNAVVNAANTSLQMGGGVCGAIFAAAGAEQLRAACDSIGGCPVGEAVITYGYNLPARYIVHTVGPVWEGGDGNEAALLRNCYTNSLTLAVQHDCQSIAFPLISSGIFGYPKDQALRIAVAAISEFLADHEIDVYLVVYDKNNFLLDARLSAAVMRYIRKNYVEDFVGDQFGADSLAMESEDRCEAYVAHQFLSKSTPSQRPQCPQRQPQRSLGQLKIDETFSEMLLRLIDAKGMTDVETYKRANIDRKLFSKIRSNKEHNPSKATTIAFAIALRLNLDETQDLLGKAGYALSPSLPSDLIVKFFIKEGNYDIHEINQYLFDYDQALLGA